MQYQHTFSDFHIITLDGRIFMLFKNKSIKKNSKRIKYYEAAGVEFGNIKIIQRKIAYEILNVNFNVSGQQERYINIYHTNYINIYNIQYDGSIIFIQRKEIVNHGNSVLSSIRSHYMLEEANSDVDNAIDYGDLVNVAMRGVVTHALRRFVTGKSVGHYFYISFNTMYEGVIVPHYIMKKYPYEMTVVIQYQFKELYVSDELVDVTLTFSGKDERIVIPINSIIAFFDPSTKFKLYFPYSINIRDIVDE